MLLSKGCFSLIPCRKYNTGFSSTGSGATVTFVTSRNEPRELVNEPPLRNEQTSPLASPLTQMPPLACPSLHEKAKITNPSDLILIHSVKVCARIDCWHRLSDSFIDIKSLFFGIVIYRCKSIFHAMKSLLLNLTNRLNNSAQNVVVNFSRLFFF